MMICGLAYNWHFFYYPKFVATTVSDDKNSSISYCNILIGRRMGYFTFHGFQMTLELSFNAPIVNLIVSSLIPFTLVALTNIVIIFYVLKGPPKRISRISLHHNGTSKDFRRSDPTHSSFRHMANQITKKDVSYETKITLTTSCVFLTTNTVASIYVYVKSSSRTTRAHMTEDLKISNVYLILRMLTLIDTVLDFYIYFLTGKKFRQEVYQVIGEILQYTPLKNYFKFTRPPAFIRTANVTNRRRQFNNKYTKTADSCIDSPQRQKLINRQFYDIVETLDRIESTV
jgi:hypothetical protein